MVKQGKRLIAVIALIAVALSAAGLTGVNAKTSVKSKSVDINATAVTLSVGDIATLTAVMKPTNSTDKLTWSSSDKAVATVNKYGTVTAIATGKATITVKTSSKKTAKCSVTVKQTLSSDEAKTLIESQMISDETLKKVVSENTLSEADVKKLIADNTLSEDDVKKLISEASTSGGSSDTWAGDVAVPMISEQKFPMLISDPNKTGIVGNITNLQVTKRHQTTSVYMDDTYIYLPYRYDVVLTANVPSITDAQKSTYCTGIILGAKDAAADISQVQAISTVSFSGNTLTELITLYSAYDIDEYFVEAAIWETK